MHHHRFPNDDGLGGHGQRTRWVGWRQGLGTTGGWIRAARVGSADGHRHGGLFHGLVRSGGKLHPQRGKVHRHARQGQAAQAFLQRGHAMFALSVKADGAVWPVAQNPPDQFGQHAARAHFHKGAHTAGVHGLNLLHKAHRLRQLRGKLGADGGGFGRVAGGSGVAVDIQQRCIERHALQKLAKRHAGACHQRAVEGRGHRQALGRHALGAQGRFNLGDFFHRARQHHLGGGIVVGHHHVGTAFSHGCTHLVNGFGHCGHGTRHGRSIAHQLAATAGHFDQAGGIQHTGFVQGRHLAKAVARHAAGHHANQVQHIGQRLAMYAQGGLRPFGGGQLFLLCLAVGIAEHRLGKHHVVQRHTVKRQVGGIVPGLACHVEGHGHFGTHTHVLAALAGEQKGQLAGIGCAGGVMHAGRAAVSGGGGFFDGGGGLGQLLRQLVGVGGDHRQACACGSGKRQLRLACCVAQLFLHTRQSAALGHQLSRAGGAEQHQLGGHCAQTPGRLARGHRRHILFQRDVEIAAAKAKTRHRRTARVRCVPDPRAALGVQVERALLDVQLGVGPVHLDGGWQHLVVQRHDGLEQTRRTRRCLGMANL